MLTSGVGTFSVTLNTTGTQTVTATDTVTTSITGTSGGIVVGPHPATHFVVTAPSTASAGVGFNVTVMAKDASGNTATGYTGTVHFTSTDSTAMLPADATLTNGTGTFNVVLKKTGSQTVTATDTATSTITGTSGPIVVSSQATTHFVVTSPSTATAGVPFNITVTAENASGATVTTYTGTVKFSSTDSKAVLPASSTLTNGTGTFSVTLKEVGSRTVMATDTEIPMITGRSPAITVTAAGASQFAITMPARVVAGTPFSFTVTAKDPFGNVATGYAGTVHFTSTDPAAVLPADSTLTNGSGTFTATLKTARSEMITATDTVTSSITSAKSTVVTAAAAQTLIVTAMAKAMVGKASPFTVTAKDAFGNVATGYTGTVHFSSTDGAATLPANATLSSGSGRFTATFATAGTQTITATDTVTSSITGTSGAIAVTP
jgi:hypothetical protein